MVSRPARLWLATVLALLVVSVGCVPLPGPSVERFVDPPLVEVDDALSFGALAPLPPRARVWVLERRPSGDASAAMAVRMPGTDVEPYFRASGIGPFERGALTPTLTVFEREVLPSACVTESTRRLNAEGMSVYRVAAVESDGAAPGIALVHLWLLTT